MNPFIGVINSLLPEPQAALLNGILFGVKTTIPNSLYQELVRTGTLHIVALSGMNISIMVHLVSYSTLFLGRKASSILSICLIVIFVWFTGASPSAVRAALMGSFSLTAIFFGKWNWGVLSLILSALIMVLYDFSLIKNISFQLSFLATLGILLANTSHDCQPKKSLSEQFIYSVRKNFRLTLSAQLFTLPVILWNFRSVSLVAPFTNILIEWMIQPIMIFGFITSLLGLIWYPLGIIPAAISWSFLTLLIHIVRLMSFLPGGYIKF